jgi:hypothetical protein
LTGAIPCPSLCPERKGHVKGCHGDGHGREIQKALQEAEEGTMKLPDFKTEAEERELWEKRPVSDSPVRVLNSPV